jgi:hypothetical protein
LADGVTEYTTAEDPFVPANANEYVNCFVNDSPSTVIGIVKTPFFVVIEVVTLTVKLADVEELLDIEVLIPVGAPDIVPMVAAILVLPLYAITEQVALPSIAAVVLPAKE